MHFRGGELEELKGKCPQGQWGEGIIPSFLSKPVSPSLLGEYEKPSLSAWPSPVVPLGQAVTLQCHSGPPFVIFRLFKRDGARLRKLQEQQFNTFTLGPVTREHAGSYTCSGANLSRSVRSNVSDPLPIVVTGRRGAAQPGTSVPAGNPTLGPCARAAKTSSGLPARTEARKEKSLRV